MTAQPCALKLVATPLVPARAPARQVERTPRVLRAPRGGVQLSFQFHHRPPDSTREGDAKGLGQG